jgi:hypothetical protein
VTHTYALMDVPPSLYGFVRATLLEAGYDHAVLTDRGEGEEHLDMHGIGLRIDSSMLDPKPLTANGSVWAIEIDMATATTQALHDMRERWDRLWRGIGQKAPPLLEMDGGSNIWKLDDPDGVFIISMPDAAPMEYMDAARKSFINIWKQATGKDVHVVIKHNVIGLEHLSDAELQHLGLQRIPK